MTDKKIKVGTCGWGYLNPAQYVGSDWKSKYKDKLQVYVSMFEVGEVNYTFHKMPSKETIELWRKRADEINPNFEFTLKAPKYITHVDKFKTDASITEFEKTKELAKILRCKIIIFQTPSSFKPTSNNIELLVNFFKKIDPENFILGWEPRGKDWYSNPEKLKKVFDQVDVIHVVDPFISMPMKLIDGIAYFRLHGSPPGKRMYYYQYTDEDLNFILKKIEELDAKEVYVMFNNIWMYDDALRLKKLINEKYGSK